MTPSTIWANATATAVRYNTNSPGKAQYLMKPGARLQAAIEILNEVTVRHRPIASALSDWGKAHRFAGSGDRAVIGNVVYDAMRQRRSAAARMDNDTPRALVLGVAAEALAVQPAMLDAFADGSRHVLAPLSDHERARLGATLNNEAPSAVQADVPDWLMPSFQSVFGESQAVAEGQAMARRAPLDLRVNTLKADRDKVTKALAHTNCVPTPWSPLGLRVPANKGARRLPNVEAEAAHGRGWFEIQDEASQIAAALAGAVPREQVLDLCAGAGGKTLALGAAMQNTGQLFAYDRDKQQLRPIFERIKRAGVRNVQVLDGGREDQLQAIGAKFDLVMVDAPCSGTGTWRRRPDSKWRLTAKQLAQRILDQQKVLTLAAGLVAPGGRLVYATCSVLVEENQDQMRWFQAQFPEFAAVPYPTQWTRVMGDDREQPTSADGSDTTLLLTPAQHSTDGFFIAVNQRKHAA